MLGGVPLSAKFCSVCIKTAKLKNLPWPYSLRGKSYRFQWDLFSMPECRNLSSQWALLSSKNA